MRDIKTEVDRLKEMWLDPKDENQPYSPNEEVERLRTLLTDRGIKSPDFELPWPYESNPIQVRLSVGKNAAKAAHEAWVRYHAALDAILTSLPTLQSAINGLSTENPTSLDSGGSPNNARMLALVEYMRKDEEQKTLGKTTKSPERKIAYRRLRAAKHDTPEIYAAAEKHHEAKKKG